ncbi:MAG: TetR/AcrR family transcriptional regulator [Deltaproteobacteria bacterium]|nr:TetR/AcrR family transcriptional regulator [Deltaproteobacteria bacterium]
MRARATDRRGRLRVEPSRATTLPTDAAPTSTRRDQVLRAAERLFARRGYDGVGLREIAQEVGIRAPSLFKHFASKQAIYNIVMRDLFEGLARAVGEAIDGAGDYEEKLDRLVEAYIDFLVARPHFSAILFRELLDDPRAVEQLTSRSGLRIYHDLERFLRAGRRAGAFRDVSVPHLLLGFTGMLTFVHTWQTGRVEVVAPTRELRRWKTEVARTMRLSLLVGDRDAGPSRRRVRTAGR